MANDFSANGLKTTVTWWKKIEVIAASVVAITAILGTIWLPTQIKILIEQNNLSEKTLRTANKPLGIPRTDSLYVAPGPVQGSFHISYLITLINGGNGILFDIGHLSYSSTRQIEFRREFLAGRIDSVIWDGRYHYARGKALMKNETNEHPVRFEKLPFRDTLYLYTLILYADFEGNLYDTEFMYVMRLKLPVPGESKFLPTIDEGTSLSCYFLHGYDGASADQLVSVINAKGHQKLSSFISQLRAGLEFGH